MKRRKKKVKFGILIFLLVVAVYSFFYVHNLDKASVYLEAFMDKSFSLSVTKDGYYLDIIPYEELSSKYRSAVSEEEFTGADTDEECMALYEKIRKATWSERNTSFFTTKGMKKGSYSEILIVDDITYRVEHDIDVRIGCFTFEPYISKWIITIETE